LLKQLKYRIREDAVQEGFAHVVENTGLMGRWMKIDSKPLTICDSAHNPSAIELAMRQLRNERYNQLHMVMGFMADKDVSAMLNMLPANAKFYFTQAQTKRALPVEKLMQLARIAHIEGTAYDHVTKALAAARENAGDKDMIYVGGSMYVLAELLTAIGYDDHLDS
jgi:dihydrofolate synthase/folylpolyglutamate synthase